MSKSSLQSGRAALADKLYNLICGPHFSVSKILETIDLADEHAALNLATRLESAMHTWKRTAAMAHSK